LPSDLYGEEDNCLRGKLIASHRDLSTLERSLPWAIAAPLALLKDTLFASVTPWLSALSCSTAVNAGSNHRGHSVATTAWVVSKRRAAGVDGGPINAIAPANKARNVAVSKVSGTTNVRAMPADGPVDAPPPEGQRPASAVEDSRLCPLVGGDRCLALWPLGPPGS
jgi:hypothetical protein